MGHRTHWSPEDGQLSLLNNCFLGEHLQERLVIVCWELVLDSVGLSPGSAEL